MLINIDTAKKDLQAWRVYHFHNGKNNDTISFTSTLMKEKAGCFSYSLNVKVFKYST